MSIPHLHVTTILQWVLNRPLRAIVTLVDIAAFTFGLFYLMASGGSSNTKLYEGLSVVWDPRVWAAALVVGAVVSVVGFGMRHRGVASWGQVFKVAAYTYATVVYLQTASALTVLPYVGLPLLISAYAYLKIRLDDEWWIK